MHQVAAMPLLEARHAATTTDSKKASDTRSSQKCVLLLA
jgi:hypothetical protein